MRIVKYIKSYKNIIVIKYTKHNKNIYKITKNIYRNLKNFYKYFFYKIRQNKMKLNYLNTTKCRNYTCKQFLVFLYFLTL